VEKYAGNVLMNVKNIRIWNIVKNVRKHAGNALKCAIAVSWYLETIARKVSSSYKRTRHKYIGNHGTSNKVDGEKTGAILYYRYRPQALQYLYMYGATGDVVFCM
jgi:hypothetical protein